MANEYNLIQFDEMPPERHIELSSKGGKASGEARRKKAAIKQALLFHMDHTAMAEEFVDDIKEFKRWQKRRDKARVKRERTRRKTRKNNSIY